MANNQYRPVPLTVLQRPTEELAYQLLNLVLVHESPEGLTAGRIVECEMYRGPGDKGAHSFTGVPTSRTQVMFGPAGHAYVYLIYGMYWCLNVVTEAAGLPHAILIRALQPLEGLELMASRHKPRKNPDSPLKLASGPGKLCRAMGIDRRHYGAPLWEPPFYLAEAPGVWPAYRVARGPRVNIDYAEEARDFPWRFWVDGHPSVSYRKGPVTTLEAVAVHS